ncbi:hypothetical protein E1A91_A08G082000v1 [Gossypium mustelinum]|uniref:Uncharacterized protein n=1 Tax=Gossypium mustelinum TaxID=34275 RepID=A0A5D2Y7E0_GOSMU|nr:hypothetical protein E1A91_A08G082000v1 [Gossypium mustelinum]
MEKAKRKRKTAQGKLRTILCGRSKTNKGITRPVITLRSHRSCSSKEVNAAAVVIGDGNLLRSCTMVR